MADPNKPEKENVHIALPPQPVAKPGTDKRSRDTVRIQLPPRQPSNKVPPSFPTEPSDPPKLSAAPSPPPPPVFSPELPTKIPTPEPDPGAPPPVSAAPDLTSLGPKKETARIALMPEPPTRPAPAVQMKKTQPLIPMPQITPQTAPVAVAPTEKAKGNAMMDAIPMSTCWTVLAGSAVILIIQIWTYFS
jgi:translation initiation factor IF-2